MMFNKDSSGFSYFQFENFHKFQNINHFVTTRDGGVSNGAYQSLNLGYGTEDLSLSVLENRHILAQKMGIPLDNFVMCNQVHGKTVKVVTKEDKSKGAFFKDSALLATDGMITNIPDICLFVMGADCVPLLFFDPVQKVIGATHAGWRGTVQKIGIETVQLMVNTYNCSLDNIMVGIGPSIGNCCYNVGGEVIDEVLRTFGTTDHFINFNNETAEAHFDLWYANKYQLKEIGIKDENIEISGLCTKCNSHTFFSSRAGNGVTGRFGAGIMLNGD